MNEPITEISPNEFATGFDNFVHVDEVTAVAAERDAALALLDQIASTLGIPDHTALPGRVADLVARVEAKSAQVWRDVVDQQAVVRAYQILGRIAAALGDPEQDHEDLPDSVEALRLHRDHLEAAARAALGEVIRG